MKTLLLTAVLLGLVAALQAQDPLFFSPQELNITGTWYVKAMVSKNLTEGRRPREVFPVTITALEGGNLEAKINFKFNGRCYEKKVLMYKLEQPGKYRDSKGHKLIFVEQLPMKDHVIIYCEKQRPGKTFGMGKLLGRSPEASPEALKEFKKFTQHKGLLQENIIMPEQKDSCVPEQN
ncbi:PREDICTED: odorant-binding protein 2b [Dipodomys ordii]|uniref:Odorant-binding protein 2b n=1 Tax=Dipodomys ordii TaxID=10020 RepID=A0A1S3FJH8_DIPOR|nr:PREDICTED: odorant-binding protein 2b [Dipodomys ordii]